MSLSPRQEGIARIAREWTAEFGEPPTVRELAAAAGLSSASSVSYQLRRMREQGVLVETRGRKARCPHCGA